jgi:hypothetical protein
VVRGDKGLSTSTLPIDEWLEIDILIVHTAQAMALVGPTGMAEFMGASLADMQIALNQSQLGHVQVRNVMPNGQVSVPVGYVEPPVGDDHEDRFRAHRRWARTSAEVAALRDAHQADIVVMAVADDGFCGIAYTQRPRCDAEDSPVPQCTVGAGYANFAFAVVSIAPERCPSISREFAHEVGHTFGLEHDPEFGGTPAAAASFGWSYGYQVSTMETQARTIMAYERFKDCPFTCPVMLHYSNPLVSFQALLPLQVPTGNDVESNDLTRQFNARTIALNARAMVGFRGPGVPPPPVQRVFRGRFEPFPDRECLVIPSENCPP